MSAKKTNRSLGARKSKYKGLPFISSLIVLFPHLTGKLLIVLVCAAPLSQ